MTASKDRISHMWNHLWFREKKKRKKKIKFLSNDNNYRINAKLTEVKSKAATHLSYTRISPDLYVCC